MKEIRSQAPQIHQLGDPCPAKWAEDVEAELGKLPGWIRSILSEFNGAELFLVAGASYRFFGIKGNNALPELYPQEWFIGPYTQEWRGHGSRVNEWVVGISAYGSLFISRPDGSVAEWDTQTAKYIQLWSNEELWFDWLVSTGKEIVSMA
jgi:hypothetical protein